MVGMYRILKFEHRLCNSRYNKKLLDVLDLLKFILHLYKMILYQRNFFLFLILAIRLYRKKLLSSQSFMISGRYQILLSETHTIETSSKFTSRPENFSFKRYDDVSEMVDFYDILGYVKVISSKAVFEISFETIRSALRIIKCETLF